MPYIPLSERPAAANVQETAGQLNYAITRLLLAYLTRKGTSYATMNEIIGALECAKAEFQRRVVAPYEDRKREQNGDVYP